MKIPVYMTAFLSRYDIRVVDIGDETPTPGNYELLKSVFFWGQNENQVVERFPSVSAGDVVKLPDGTLYVCMGHGWQKVTPEQFNSYAEYMEENRRDGLFEVTMGNLPQMPH